MRTGKANQCLSVSVNGLYSVAYRWPVWGENGEIAGCIGEHIFVSPHKDKIHEMRSIIEQLDACNGYSQTISPKQSTRTVTFDALVGESPSMRLLKEKGKRFALHDEPVLILGENGTGKDMIAQAIHAASPRCENNFVAVNCAAIPTELMESELFGYSAGAFTGAKSTGKRGQFELAEGGTIFLDEIGELPLPLQAKLLRVLEKHEIPRLGSTSPRRVDFRLISATNRNLEQMVQQGTFREDLYYRLNLFDLVVPPLRERLADIPLLCYSMLTDLTDPERMQQLHVAKEVLSLFSTHPWRGNVRELRNILTYALYSMGENETELAIHHLPERFLHAADRSFLSTALGDETAGAQGLHSNRIQAGRREEGTAQPGVAKQLPQAQKRRRLSDSRQEAERKAIIEALEMCSGNKVKAAKMLGIARSCLYKRLASLNIH